MSYLYGAAVQGIQQFIFQANELKDIVGASELVENICTELFAKTLYDIRDSKKAIEKLHGDKSTVLNAAGNIKYIFDKEEDCKKIVLEFPKIVTEYAPGITISQAVVKMDGGKDFSDYVNDLEKKLRAQRNRPMQSTTVGLMGILRSHKTGKPVVEEHKGEFMDEATFCKLYHRQWDTEKGFWRKRTTKSLCRKAFGISDIKGNPDSLTDSQIAYDIKKITDKNDWIAVIHADGNGLGQVVQKVGKNRDKFKEFSQDLDKATTNAAVKAYESVKDKFANKKIIPIRPIVLGGDDLTVICRADIALDFVTAFIKEFEEQTKLLLGKILTENKVFTEGTVRDRLTACAGIAYIKSSYPFYYGYELAEALCSAAKKDAKRSKIVKEGKALPPSCLMFHKVQDSFVVNYDDITQRELTPQENISFKFGPYYIAEEKNRWTVENLLKKANALEGKEGNAVKSHLRQWTGMLHDKPKMAEQMLFRLKEITSMTDYVNEVTTGIAEEGVTRYPVYDILAIHTINTQETKNEEDAK